MLISYSEKEEILHQSLPSVQTTTRKMEKLVHVDSLQAHYMPGLPVVSTSSLHLPWCTSNGPDSVSLDSVMLVTFALNSEQ